jgi:hypothetical protein
VEAAGIDGQEVQPAGAGMSIRLAAPWGRNWTAIVSAGAFVSLRSMWTSSPPGSTKPLPAL